MQKAKAIRWLEDQTGQSIDYTPELTGGRDHHLSVRLNRELVDALSAMADERALSLSQLVRELLTDIVNTRHRVAALDAQALSDRLAADVAEVRRRLAG
jgi:molybdopterin-guanine dinucleotide biosynthesis protein A